MLLRVKLTPKAKSTKITGVILDEQGEKWLKVSVTAVPEDGKANEALIKLLSKTFKLSKSSFHLVSGHTTRFKMIKIIHSSQSVDFEKIYELYLS